MRKVTCLIPGYNEGERIESVIKAVYKHKLINEVIVINDGSTDNTDEVVKKFKNVKLITYKKNRGKTLALREGIKKAKGDILVLIDSDLAGLNEQNITDLVLPIINGKADISFAIDYNSSIFMKIFIKISGMENFSGLRAFNKKILDKEFYKVMDSIPGYGFETLMNKKILDENLRLKIIYWRNVSNTLKAKKIGFLRGTWKDWVMFSHIIRTTGVIEYLRQTFFIHST